MMIVIPSSSVTVAILLLARGTRRFTAAESRSSSHGITSPLLRGRTLLHPHKSSSSSSSSSTSSSSYKGCLGYSNSELSRLSWNLQGYQRTGTNSKPSCSWLHSGSSSISQGDSSSGESDYDDDNDSGNNINDNFQDDECNDDANEDNYGQQDESANDGNGGNGDDDGSNQVYGNAIDDEEVIVSNEDVSHGNSNYDPMEDFNIQLCDTFENLWLWDLGLSCGSSISSSNDDTNLVADGCNCTFAQELFDADMLSCQDRSLCPNNCTVCATCLNLVCDFPRNRFLFANPLVYYLIAAAALALLIFGLVAHYVRSRNKKNDKDGLSKNLIDPRAMRVQADKVVLDGNNLTWVQLPEVPVYNDPEFITGLQPTGTMSTASTGDGRLFPEVSPKVRYDHHPKNSLCEPLSSSSLCRETTAIVNQQEESLGVVLSTVDAFHDEDVSLDAMVVSPIQTSEEESSFEDNKDIDDNISSENDNLVFEDLASPMSSSVQGEEKTENQ